MHPTTALFRRNAWATDRLLNWCAQQPSEVTSTAAEDVYGSIDGLFNHIAAAEVRYLYVLTGNAPDGAVNEQDNPQSLKALPKHIQRSAKRWEELLREDRDTETLHERTTLRGNRVELPDWVPLAQALHHGDDHRAQVGTLLGRSDKAAPELDVWMFLFYCGDLESEPAPAGWAGPLLRRCFEHHLFATRQVLEAATSLTAEQLQLETQGTYGSILATLNHLVGADLNYLRRLRHGGRGEPLENASPAELMELLERQAAGWRDYLDSEPDFEESLELSDGTYPAWVVVAQAAHHGNDHRTHVGTTLLHHGLEVPGIDVWAYGDAEGVLRDLA